MLFIFVKSMGRKKLQLYLIIMVPFTIILVGKKNSFLNNKLGALRKLWKLRRFI